MVAICQSLGIFSSVICYVFGDDKQLAQIFFGILVLLFHQVYGGAIESFVFDIGPIYGGDFKSFL